MRDGLNRAELTATINDMDGSVYPEPHGVEVVQYAIPPALAPFVTQIYCFSCNEQSISDAIPAVLGHLVLILDGDGELRFHDGHKTRLHQASVLGPASAATEFQLNGPFRHIGLAISPLGFVALTGKAASSYSDRMVNAADILGKDIDLLVDELRRDSVSGKFNQHEAIAKISAYLVKRAQPVPAKHQELIAKVEDWLSSEFNPDVNALYPNLNMARNTASRLIRRHFGLTPKAVTRKYRAIRAATCLCDPHCTDEMRRQIETLFYDQPHMIREVRHYTGRTPGALTGGGSKILKIWLKKENYRDVDITPPQTEISYHTVPYMQEAT